MKKILQKILTVLAKLYLIKYKPKIVAVTGNVGKTSTKEAIAAVLRSSGKRVRMSEGNLNNELGVPLAILGNYGEEYYEKGGSALFWLKVLFKATSSLFFGWLGRNYPEILVLEYGADRPGDIAKLAKNFKPQVGVVTAVGEIPVHVEYFSGPEELAEEKSKLIEALIVGDFAVLNYDDQIVLEMREKTKARISTFGFGEGVDVRISDFNLTSTASGEPEGVVFQLHHQSSFTPFKVDGSLGKSQAWAAAAAAAVGLIFGLNLVKISDALSSYQGPAGRLRILKGLKNSFLIDDTYNASPASTHLALETLKILSARRKIAILGDMLELGQYSIQAHQKAGDFVGTFATLLITVGLKAKFIAEAAGHQMLKENILSFTTSAEAASKVRELVKESDLILVKGSQGMRMEKVVEEIMAEPERKRELLVRQNKKWIIK